MGAQLHLISTHPAGEVSSTRELDVVFVHGLGGDPFGTWRYGEDETTSWPHWLAKEYGEKLGVWSFGYPANKSMLPRHKEGVKKLLGLPYNKDAGYSMPLPDRARNALNVMVKRGIGQRPCIFIAHSLGGLLVKYVLNLAHDEDDHRKEHALIANCKALLFLATPHQGSGLASLAKEFKFYFPSITIDELRDNDSHLRKLYQWYRKHAPEYHIDTRSFSEARATGGVIVVVKPDSADPGTGRDPLPHDANHLEISRPDRKDDEVVLEAKELIDAQLPQNDQLPLNPGILRSELPDSPIPDPFPNSDFHLKVSVEESSSTKLQLLRRESEGGSKLACRVAFRLYQGQAECGKTDPSENYIAPDMLTFHGNDPGPLIKHLERLLRETIGRCRYYHGVSSAALRLHLHLTLPLAWLSGPLPERIQQALEQHVFFGCSKREDVAGSAVFQWHHQAKQVNQSLHRGDGLSSLRWATACHEEALSTGLEQLFDRSPQVIHLKASGLDGEDDHSPLVGRDALLAAEPRLLFSKQYSASGQSGDEESALGRWERLVKIGLPLVLWWRSHGTDPLSSSLDRLGGILKGSWCELLGHLELLGQMLESQEVEKRAMKALMQNLGIFYEEPLRYPAPDRSATGSQTAPAYQPLDPLCHPHHTSI